MENSSHLLTSEPGGNEDIVELHEEEDVNEHGYHGTTGVDWASQGLQQDPGQDSNRCRGSFPCQHCDRQFTSEKDMECHLCIEKNNDNTHKESKQVKFLHSSGSDAKLHPEDHTAMSDRQGMLAGHHACKYCEKIFSTYVSRRQHELSVHEQHLQDHCIETFDLPQEDNIYEIIGMATEEEVQHVDLTSPVAALESKGKELVPYMLDVSSSVSENLSFYIDGKIVSTSTVSSCETAEVHSGTAAHVGVDTLILDPSHISQVLNSDSVTGKDTTTSQTLAKRRTATPPLLPQIQTELESEVVVSSSSSSLVSSLIENLLPQSSESTVVQTERTVFLSPKLTRLLEKQDGLKPTLALITDGQTSCSPISLSVLPAGTGKFKRRTGSPPSSPQQSNSPNEESSTADGGDGDAVSAAGVDTQQTSPSHWPSNETEEAASSAGESVVNPIAKPWSPIIGGNSCNQQPLDLSNTVKTADDAAAAALDLSLQKKSPDHSWSSLPSNSPSALTEGALSVNLEAPMVPDYTLVSPADMAAPLGPVADRLVYGLALPTSSLTPAATSLTSVALQPAAPCSIAFAASAPHAVLTTTPPLITVLAPPPTLSSTSSQPLQVLAPTLSPEPLVICAENPLNPPKCDLSGAFTAASALTLSQSLNPALNLPGQLFLTDQISLSNPIGESTAGPEVPFPSTVNLSDSLLNSFNITSNTVLIECTISLEAPGSVVPTAIALQENAPEGSVPAPLVINHVEQEQIISLPTAENEGPPNLSSTVPDSAHLSSSSPSATTNTVAEAGPVSKPVLVDQPPSKDEEVMVDSSVSTPEVKAGTDPICDKGEEPSTDVSQLQTFTKNFVCNVCDKLFHSMKELGQHVSQHADEWPYKCEFCVLLFGKPSALLDHRSSLHGVGKTYVCSVCTKEFVYLCNLKQHQEELHPGHQCTHTEEEKGKLRPQNYNNAVKVNVGEEASVPDVPEEPKGSVKKEEGEADATAEELLTTMKILASDAGKQKGPDIRLGINQHYPSFKPPPFPYHNRSPAGSLASATNFTTHNIPQTFTTAIRCTKCGKSFDNMPELHKHILACANASDKRRYTPKKNPIPLRHFAKPQNGVLSTTNPTNGLNASYRTTKPKSQQDSAVKVKLKVLNKKKKKQLVQRPQRNKAVSSSNKGSPARGRHDQEVFVCPHCSREFTLRRCRTKHMAVCPQKPKEAKKSKESGACVTKENNGHLHRGVSRAEDKPGSGPHKTRLQTSSPGKRPAILPVQTILSSKRSKIIIKETKPEPSALGDLPISRTFNPAMRQYSRAQHGVKITIVTPPAQGDAQRDQQPSSHSQDSSPPRVTTGASQQSATV